MALRGSRMQFREAQEEIGLSNHSESIPARIEKQTYHGVTETRRKIKKPLTLMKTSNWHLAISNWPGNPKTLPLVTRMSADSH
jgi:hypothetical protein